MASSFSEEVNPLLQDPLQKSAKQGMKFMAIGGQEDIEKVRKSKKIYPKATKGNRRKPYHSLRKQSEHEMTDMAKMWKKP